MSKENLQKTAGETPDQEPWLALPQGFELIINSCYADKIEGFNLTHELPEQKRRFLRSVAANCPVKPLFSKNCVTRKSASEPNVFRVKRKLPFLFA